MESIIGLKDEIKKLFLIYFIPGILGTWPLLILFYNWLQNHFGFTFYVLKDYPTTTYIITLLLIYGTGHFIAKLGSRMEILLEKAIYSESTDYEQFYKNWYGYLSLNYKKSEPPLFIRYYDEFIIGLKFEFNVLIAVIIMLSSLAFLEPSGLTNFMSKNQLLCLTVFSGIIWLFLFHEAWSGITQADELRKDMITKIKSITKEDK